MLKLYVLTTGDIPANWPNNIFHYWYGLLFRVNKSNRCQYLLHKINLVVIGAHLINSDGRALRTEEIVLGFSHDSTECLHNFTFYILMQPVIPIRPKGTYLHRTLPGLLLWHCQQWSLSLWYLQPLDRTAIYILWCASFKLRNVYVCNLAALHHGYFVCKEAQPYIRLLAYFWVMRHKIRPGRIL